MPISNPVESSFFDTSTKMLRKKYLWGHTTTFANFEA